MLITDYSGIFFDFLLLEKPIIFYCYDYYKYLKKDRELYFHYLDKDITPGPKVYEYTILKKEILSNLKRGDKFINNLKKAKRTFHEDINIKTSENIFNFIKKNS